MIVYKIAAIYDGKMVSMQHLALEHHGWSVQYEVGKRSHPAYSGSRLFAYLDLQTALCEAKIFGHSAILRCVTEHAIVLRTDSSLPLIGESFVWSNGYIVPTSWPRDSFVRSKPGTVLAPWLEPECVLRYIDGVGRIIKKECDAYLQGCHSKSQ